MATAEAPTGQGMDQFELAQDVLIGGNGNVVEEIEEDSDEFALQKQFPEPVCVSPPLPEISVPAPALTKTPEKTREREFGNISPITELLDLDDDDIITVKRELDIAEEEGSDAEFEGSTGAEAEGKVTPEPEARKSFPRISDGRSSPILAFSPSLIKSPSSNGSNKLRARNSGSPASDKVQKRPRNITRILDNISDHSSGDEEKEINNVGVLMAKFKV